MKRHNSAPVAILAVLLVACLIAVYVTRDAAVKQAAPAKNTTIDQGAAVDTRLLQTANQLAARAETAGEQSNAREALRLTDHELDQAFATALRKAAAYRAPAGGPLRTLTARLNQLKVQIAADESRIALLTKQSDSDDEGRLDLAKAQLALDQDDLEDVQQDLARQGGDPRAGLERVRQEHENIQHQTAQALKGAPLSPTGTLAEQIRAWLSLGSLNGLLLSAERQAEDQAAALGKQHDQLEEQVGPFESSAIAQGTGATTDKIAGLHWLSDERKTLAELDGRVQDCKQLAGVYRAWSTIVETRRRAVAHLLLTSIAEILTILLAAFLVHIAIRGLFRKGDRKRLQQAQVITAVAVQLAAVVLILLVIFGTPYQLSTIIGLATAGLTVVLKDFIVAFFGWFTLMGKNGIRVGDWVEINGVSGEVIEIGLLKTVLLELGNWTDTGHPTGRKVAFSNSFAMERHYFNFSTAGQWLWDELAVTLPAAGDPYLKAQEIRQLVEHETEADSEQAAQDWERVTTRYGARSFSAKPAVNLRPTGSGLEVVVRYITRAPQRNAMKSKLFQLIVDLLHKPATATV